MGLRSVVRPNQLGTVEEKDNEDRTNNKVVPNYNKEPNDSLQQWRTPKQQTMRRTPSQLHSSLTLFHAAPNKVVVTTPDVVADKASYATASNNAMKRVL